MGNDPFGRINMNLRYIFGSPGVILSVTAVIADDPTDEMTQVGKGDVIMLVSKSGFQELCAELPNSFGCPEKGFMDKIPDENRLLQVKNVFKLDNDRKQLMECIRDKTLEMFECMKDKIPGKLTDVQLKQFEALQESSDGVCEICTKRKQ
ncbi:hypothetical protein NPIL_377621 [Nephila pilipes]|uniref:Uncharacterized protein n=1 Tax=Nephila pilipes TaxID=299642 RepID=A0A8X6JCK4_NEPPI|nr:hypothetical protein NPIL_377621 [Nephila pilipes]